MIVKPSQETIARASDILRRGGLVGIPTETVYGLAANALDPYACAKIFEAKKRPYFDPLIVHIADRIMLSRIARDIPDPIERLIDKFWPGPLTVVLPKTDDVPDIVTSGLHTVAVRMPAHDVPRQLIQETGCPLAAPSANPFGYLSPTEAIHVDEQLGDQVELILDGGRCIVGIESTIVKYHEGSVYCLRPGGLSIEEMESVLGIRVVMVNDEKLPEAPGQMLSHYAPNARVVIIKEGDPIPEGPESALCAFRENRRSGRFSRVEILSQSGDIREAAANLFSALHRLDASGASIIYAEKVPEEGVGLAIMNRLRKAAARRS
jgi:L-threonylcarbamoyladenylate synthase